MDYPGRLVRVGESDASLVRAVAARLKELGCGPVDTGGVFGAQTKASVQLFQARHVDNQGRPLKQDGVIGSLTWEALFGSGEVATVTAAASPLLAAALSVAAGKVGVLEDPKDSNSGRDVDAFLTSVGVPLGLPATRKPWCCAFVYWCLNEAARSLGRPNPMVRTAGCLDHWNRAVGAGAARIASARAIADPSLVLPGMIFIIDHTGGRGHTGFVESVAGGLLRTIEGNTDASRTREGGGVYRLTRKVAEINKGFVDYGAA